MTKSLTHTELEELEQANANVRNDSIENDDGTFVKHEDICNKKDESRLFYGTHETQVSERETDLHKYYNTCVKNPGHTQFVPVKNFNIDHLPYGYYDDDLAEYIKATADLTVSVTIKMTCSKRPEVWPNTTYPYHFYNLGGSDIMRTGTGKVRYANNWTNEYNKGTCQCHKCQHSDTPSKVWGQVTMHTATLVVFDDLEARHTTCRLFYDSEDSSLVTLDGWTVLDADIEEDRCFLKCVICNVDLLAKLVKIVRHWFYQWKKVNKKYTSSRDEVKLTFIVSHPHGCPKQVSVGHWINRDVVWRNNMTRAQHAHVQAVVGPMSTQLVIMMLTGCIMSNSNGTNFSCASQERA